MRPLFIAILFSAAATLPAADPAPGCGAGKAGGCCAAKAAAAAAVPAAPAKAEAAGCCAKGQPAGCCAKATGKAEAAAGCSKSLLATKCPVAAQALAVKIRAEANPAKCAELLAQGVPELKSETARAKLVDMVKKAGEKDAGTMLLAAVKTLRPAEPCCEKCGKDCKDGAECCEKCKSSCCSSCPKAMKCGGQCPTCRAGEQAAKCCPKAAAADPKTASVK